MSLQYGLRNSRAKTVGTYKTWEEVREEGIGLMGPDLGETYILLGASLVELYVKWGLYRAIYGTSEERVKLVNRAAGLFFQTVQNSLWDDILVHISRLTDRPKTAGKESLTILRLSSLIECKETLSVCEKHILVAKERCSFARDWRNRRIAHSDLEHRLNPSSKPLEAASRKNIDDALASIASVLNVLSRRYIGSTMMYEESVTIGDAEAILYALNDGLRLRAMLPEWKKQGNQVAELFPNEKL